MTRRRRTRSGRGWKPDGPGTGNRRTGTAGLSDPGLPVDPGSQPANRGGAGHRNGSGPQPVSGHAADSGRSRQGPFGSGGEDAGQTAPQIVRFAVLGRWSVQASGHSIAKLAVYLPLLQADTPPMI